MRVDGGLIAGALHGGMMAGKVGLGERMVAGFGWRGRKVGIVYASSVCGGSRQVRGVGRLCRSAFLKVIRNIFPFSLIAVSISSPQISFN